MDDDKRDEFYELWSNRLESVRLTLVEDEEVRFTSKVYFIDEKKIELTFKKVNVNSPLLSLKTS